MKRQLMTVDDGLCWDAFGRSAEIIISMVYLGGIKVSPMLLMAVNSPGCCANQKLKLNTKLTLASHFAALGIGIFCRYAREERFSKSDYQQLSK
jgi:hypothetical protein